MKKILLFIAITILLCGCGKEKIPNDACEFLVQAQWEGNDTQCVNGIRFSEDKSFSNWCFCGSPVGDGDMVEEFRYDSSNKSVLLIDDEGEVMETGKILYVDDLYLVIDLWGRCYVYENMKKERPMPNSIAIDQVGTAEMSKPYWSVLGYENGKLKVTSYDYDGDAKDNFDTWTFDLHKEAKLLEVSVTVKNGVASMESKELQESDYQHIGEYYTCGYMEIDRDGKVVGIVFYGETIVEE